MADKSDKSKVEKTSSQTSSSLKSDDNSKLKDEIATPTKNNAASTSLDETDDVIILPTPVKPPPLVITLDDSDGINNVPKSNKGKKSNSSSAIEVRVQRNQSQQGNASKRKQTRQNNNRSHCSNETNAYNNSYVQAIQNAYADYNNAGYYSSYDSRSYRYTAYDMAYLHEYDNRAWNNELLNTDYSRPWLNNSSMNNISLYSSNYSSVSNNDFDYRQNREYPAHLGNYYNRQYYISSRSRSSSANNCFNQYRAYNSNNSNESQQVTSGNAQLENQQVTSDNSQLEIPQVTDNNLQLEIPQMTDNNLQLESQQEADCNPQLESQQEADCNPQLENQNATDSNPQLEKQPVIDNNSQLENQQAIYNNLTDANSLSENSRILEVRPHESNVIQSEHSESSNFISHSEVESSLSCINAVESAIVNADKDTTVVPMSISPENTDEFTDIEQPLVANADKVANTSPFSWSSDLTPLSWSPDNACYFSGITQPPVSLANTDKELNSASKLTSLHQQINVASNSDQVPLPASQECPNPDSDLNQSSTLPDLDASANKNCNNVSQFSSSQQNIAAEDNSNSGLLNNTIVSHVPCSEKDTYSTGGIKQSSAITVNELGNISGSPSSGNSNQMSTQVYVSQKTTVLGTDLNQSFPPIDNTAENVNNILQFSSSQDDICSLGRLNQPLTVATEPASEDCVNTLPLVCLSYKNNLSNHENEQEQMNDGKRISDCSTSHVEDPSMARNIKDTSSNNTAIIGSSPKEISNLQQKEYCQSQLMSDTLEVTESSNNDKITSEQVNQSIQSFIPAPIASIDLCANVNSNVITYDAEQSDDCIEVLKVDNPANENVSGDSDEILPAVKNVSDFLSVLLSKATKKMNAKQKSKKTSPLSHRYQEKEKRSILNGSEVCDTQNNESDNQTQTENNLNKICEASNVCTSINHDNLESIDHSSKIFEKSLSLRKTSRKRKSSEHYENMNKRKSRDAEKSKTSTSIIERAEDRNLNNEPTNFIPNIEVTSSASSSASPFIKDVHLSSDVLPTCNLSQTMGKKSLKKKSSKKNLNKQCSKVRSQSLKHSDDNICFNRANASDSQNSITNVPYSPSQSFDSFENLSLSSFDNALSEICNLSPHDKKLRGSRKHISKLNKLRKKLKSEDEVIKLAISDMKSKIEEYELELEKCKLQENMLCLQQEGIKERIQAIDRELTSRKKRKFTVSLVKDKPKNNNNKKSSKEILPTSSKAAEVSPSSSKRAKNASSSSSKRAKNASSSSSERAKNVSSSLSSSSGNSKQSKMNNGCNISKDSRKQESNETSDNCDEVTILPTVVKQPLVITLDDDDDEENCVSSRSSPENICKSKPGTSILTRSGKGKNSFAVMKKFTGHSEPVNNIMVFEDYVYTTSNDCTAKRFSLQDISDTVTYIHTSVSVQNLVVGRVQNTTVVCTSSCNNQVNFFGALNGGMITCFQHDSPVSSICKGSGKVYAGWADGLIHIYDWTSGNLSPTKTNVPNEHPISCIATTTNHEQLSMLIVLQKDGKVMLRGADTGVFLFYIDNKVKIPSLMAIHRNSAYFCSVGENSLSVLDFVTRKLKRQFSINKHTVGFAIAENYLLTVSVNSGVVTCYKIGKASDKMMYYGAGRKYLTCIYVHDNWVFTGSKKGSISAFKFDPNASEVCKHYGCNAVYGSKVDLLYHIKTDHLPNHSRCGWRNCYFSFGKRDTVTMKMEHMYMHV